MTERVGWSAMPYYDTVGFLLDDDGYLILDTPEDCGILPSGMEIILQELTLTTTAEKE